MKKNTPHDAMGQRISKTVTNKNVATGDQFVTTYYVRDPQGNVLAVYEKKEDAAGAGQFQLKERHLYGLNRLGMVSQNVTLAQFDNSNVTNGANPTTPQAGDTHYELTNHLGNVMAVISDEASDTAEPAVVSLSDYYPFGMTMGGRSYSADEYRYGFQGQDRERELWGGEASFFKYRISDNRLGRFFSVDPLSSKFPWNSSYAFSENRVIDGVELEGTEYLSVNDPNITSSQKNDDGTSNVVLGDFTFSNVDIENIGGIDYYNLKQHMYLSQETCSWSDNGSRFEQQTEETKVGLELVSELLSIENKKTLCERPWHGPEATVVDTRNEAHKWINPGGLCYVNTMERVNEAYKKVHGNNVQVLSFSGFDYYMSAHIAIGKASKDKNFDFGVAGALANKGYATLIAHDEIMAGKLQIGAVIQKWGYTESGIMWGHSQIFVNYVYDSNGNITGYDYIDAHGYNGEAWDREFNPTRGSSDPLPGTTIKYGGNLIDR